jgi:dTDP-4-amino-4,6-dideoxygalactose transaminase
MSYNPWPLGDIPAALRRPEPELIRKLGYKWTDAREIVGIFEQKVADMFGSKYAVAVDCCTHALELSLRFIGDNELISIPKHTYISVPSMFPIPEYAFSLEDIKWHGYYFLEPTNVIDAAWMWKRGSYIKGSLMCLSFQIKKPLPIGRGGMILTDREDAYDWLRLARYDGRDLDTPYDSEDHVKMFGWHYYMTPEDAARGLLLMEEVPSQEPTCGWEHYPDISKIWERL